jgi:PAS domain S-box-containing protein
LRRQSRALQALIDNLPHMAWLKDRDGRFVAVNRSSRRSTGSRPSR